MVDRKVSATRWRRAVLATLLGVVGAVAVAGPAWAGPPLDVEASLDGRAVAEAGANDPIELGAEEQVEVTMTVTNRSSAPVEVRSVKLAGWPHALKPPETTTWPASVRLAWCM